MYVLYPKGKVSPIQECQFTTLGRNITALEIDGVFDDCQALVKAAFMDPDLNRALRLTSANSINVARFLPQSFYYFWAYAQLQRLGLGENVVCSVPSGNFGNICSALFGKRMGLPICRVIAANNANSVFYEKVGEVSVKCPQSVLKVSSKFPLRLLKVFAKFPRSVLGVLVTSTILMSIPAKSGIFDGTLYQNDEGTVTPKGKTIRSKGRQLVRVVFFFVIRKKMTTFVDNAERVRD